jgi:hypothetical protein
MDRGLTRSNHRGRAGRTVPGPATHVSPAWRELPLIAIEVPLPCDLHAARRIFETPLEVLSLWPGVESAVRAKGSVLVRQRLALPFWKPQTLDFAVDIEAAPRDRRRRYAIWHTDGWFFDRAVLWKIRTGRTGPALNFASQHAVSAHRLEEAVNAYRSRSIWPMRHDADAILERLTMSFIYDRLVEMDRAYVDRVRVWLDADRSADVPASSTAKSSGKSTVSHSGARRRITTP